MSERVSGTWAVTWAAPGNQGGGLLELQSSPDGLAQQACFRSAIEKRRVYVQTVLRAGHVQLCAWLGHRRTLFAVVDPGDGGLIGRLWRQVAEARFEAVSEVHGTRLDLQQADSLFELRRALRSPVARVRQSIDPTMAGRATQIRCDDQRGFRFARVATTPDCPFVEAGPSPFPSPAPNEPFVGVFGV